MNYRRRLSRPDEEVTRVLKALDLTALYIILCIKVALVRDPAAGSGNFLTESYLCLRKMEKEIIDLLQHGQIVMGAAHNPIKVSIAQFYGIEINDFAATVAKTALWIAES